MSILDTFFILFEGDTSHLDKGLKESDKKSSGLLDKLKKVDAEATGTGRNLRSLIEHAAGLAGVGLSLGAIVAGVHNTAKEYFELSKLAAQFRSTVSAVDEFRDASGLLGITQEQSTESLKAMERVIQDVVLDMGRAKKVFEELHINVKDGNGHIKSTVSLMGELSQKFKTLDRGTQIRVMERLGLDPGLLKLFNGDLLGLQKRMADVDRAAGFNIETAVKRAQDYTKASRALNIEFKTLELFLSKLSESFKIAALPWFTSAMERATVVVKEFVGFVMRHSHFVEGVMIAIAAAISYYLIPAAISGALAVWAMIAPFALIGAIALGVAAVFALLYDDVRNFFEGNQSLIGDMLQRWPVIGEVFADIRDVLESLWEVMKFFGEVALDVARILAREFAIAFDFVGGKLADLAEWITEKLAPVGAFFLGLANMVAQAVSPAVAIFRSFGDAVGAIIQALIDKVAAFFDRFGGVVGVAKAVAGWIRERLGDAKAQLDITDNTREPGAPARADRLPTSPQVPARASAPAHPVAGRLPPRTAAAVAAGQGQLRAAAASPWTTTNTTSIVHSAMAKRGGDRNVHIDKIEVQTQATDAEGISRSIGQSLGTQLRHATSQLDDGVAA